MESVRTIQPACTSRSGQRYEADRPANDVCVIGFTAAMASLFRQDGPWTDGIKRHASAAAAAQRLGDRLSEADVLNDLGVVRLMTGEYTNAIEALESALSIASDIGDRLAQLNANNYLTDVRRRTGDLGGAMEASEATPRISIELGDRQGEASGLFQIGAVRCLAGDFPGAFEAGQTRCAYTAISVTATVRRRT